MKNLLLALQFLTIIPFPGLLQVKSNGYGKSLIYFPLAGLLLGLILAGTAKALYASGFNQLLVSAILVTLLTIITGGLHLDGLSDTFDALLSRRGKEEMLAIMRDSRIGVMGALSLICAILLKISLLYSIMASSLTTGLLLMCVLSRWSMVFAISLFPYARREGKAKIFFEGANIRIFILATIIALICAVLAGKANGLFIFGIVIISAYVINKIMAKEIGGLTGDTLGAINELVEIIVLFGVYILGGGRVCIN